MKAHQPFQETDLVPLVALEVQGAQPDQVVLLVLKNLLSLGVQWDQWDPAFPHLLFQVDQVAHYLLLSQEDQEFQLVLLRHPYQGFL